MTHCAVGETLGTLSRNSDVRCRQSNGKEIAMHGNGCESYQLPKVRRVESFCYSQLNFNQVMQSKGHPEMKKLYLS